MSTLFKLSLLILVSYCTARDGGFRICFRETERSSQCQGPSHTCSGWSTRPGWTKPFRDDTDNRGGGCKYQWRIEASEYFPLHHEYRLCFAEIEGSSQCQGNRHSCTGWSRRSPSWTAPFRDDTDNRSGGCKYMWRIESRRTEEGHGQHGCRVCFRETEGSSQCQGTRSSCSGMASSRSLRPAWTRVFRDDTDNRSGGCHYQWLLDCK